MKKYLFCIIAAALAIAASSFSQGKKSTMANQAAAGGYHWFDFNGGLLDQCDPYAYSLDPNDFPDCPPSLGLVNCEILALPSAFDPMVPDLNTIISVRMKLL